MRYDETNKRYLVEEKDRDDILWAAGFYEGEGSLGIGYFAASSSFNSSLIVSQKALEPLEFLQGRFGGKIYTRWYQFRDDSLGSPQNRWTLTGRKAVAFLELILPHLKTISRKHRAELFISFVRAESRDTRIRLLKTWRAESPLVTKQ